MSARANATLSDNPRLRLTPWGLWSILTAMKQPNGFIIIR